MIVRRDQLASLPAFAGVVLRELGHALSGETDGSLALTALAAVPVPRGLSPARPK